MACQFDTETLDALARRGFTEVETRELAGKLSSNQELIAREVLRFDTRRRIDPVMVSLFRHYSGRHYSGHYVYRVFLILREYAIMYGTGSNLFRWTIREAKDNRRILVKRRTMPSVVQLNRKVQKQSESFEVFCGKEGKLNLRVGYYDLTAEDIEVLTDALLEHTEPFLWPAKIRQ